MMFITSLIFLTAWGLLIVAAVRAVAATQWPSRSSRASVKSVSPFRRWWQLKRVCVWCQPMRYMGGNPFAKQQTHGMCHRCLGKIAAQVEQEAETHKPAPMIVLTPATGREIKQRIAMRYSVSK